MSLVWEAFKVVMALAVLIPLAYFFTKFYASKASGPSSGAIKVIDRMALGANRSLLLVSVAGKVFFLGLGEKGIEKLGEWDDDGSLTSLSGGKVPGFASALRRAVQKGEREDIEKS